MSNPVRNLPLVQNWDCQSCGDCCRELEAVITDGEKRRIEGLDLAGDAEIALGPWFVRRGWWSKTWALKHRPGGGCVFLTAGNHCRLHERFGAEVKPFACRLFPFLLIPAGNHWRVGMRFSCPTVGENKGRPLQQYDAELAYFSHLLEKHTGRDATSAPVPPLQLGQEVSWPDLLRFVAVLAEIVQDRNQRLELRLRRCLALARLCRQAKFDKLAGARLEEFLRLAAGGLGGDVPSDPKDVPAPSWIGRVLFRSLLAIFARKDRGHDQGPAARGRLARMHAGWRFVRGRGRVPRVNNYLPETTFAEVARRPAPAAEIDVILERYYLTKLHSLQFCGPANFNLPFWAGLESLMLTYPMIEWLARALAHLGPVPAVRKAILLVDNHFGGNPLLGFRHVRFFQRTLAQRGDTEKLIAWSAG